MAEKNYDSEFCGSLPLHQINQIQDYGYLLVLDKQSLQIIQVSENAEELFELTPAAIIGHTLSKFVGEAQISALKSKLERGLSDKIPVTLDFESPTGKRQMLAVVHSKSDYLILELEKVDQDFKRYFTDVYQEIKFAMAAIEAAASVEEVCKVAIHELKKLSGFDGIMMYRFDENWNGTVIAEEKEPGMEEYMGLTFPASDIPKQARAMYQNNPYRLIPNRNYTPVRLYPVINPLTHAFIDLSDCNLRSVANVHLEYLKNMNVVASMSTRVIKDGRLWGLIACHHLTPRYLNYEICSIFELLSNVISTRVSSILSKENFDLTTTLQQKRSELVEFVYAEDDLAKGLLKHNEVNLLDMFNATGAAVTRNGNVKVLGQVPERDQMENLIFWLQGKDLNKAFSINNLASIYDDAEEFAAIGSGLLAIPVDSEKGDYIICFRPEQVRTINWGGNPDEAINFEGDGKNYHPRNSFKLWQQTVRQTSLPWKGFELAAAEELRSFAFEFKTKQVSN